MKALVIILSILLTLSLMANIWLYKEFKSAVYLANDLMELYKKEITLYKELTGQQDETLKDIEKVINKNK